ncbi:Uncharacterised protein [Mycobacteroides abscessus subsp. abscessus]|nr:Uncharacterised protein [Mycobacteroides abscessus subsp. abscessus]
MKPSIGRIVHYQHNGAEPLPAIVVAVDGDRVDLTWFGPFGLTSFRRGVEYSEAPKVNYWSWPPRV